MRKPSVCTAMWTSLTVIVFLSCWASSPKMEAQQGENAVFNSTTTPSPAYIDASVFSGTDLCSILSTVYSTSGVIPAAGAVIDARGITVGISNPCAAKNPWPSSGTVPPTTVLLPAGTIVITVPWVLPNATRIIGENRGTQIYENFTTANNNAFMISMGSSTYCPSGCEGIVVQDVELQNGESATATGVGGIDNEYAGEFSYIDHVVVNGFTSTGVVGLDGIAFKVGNTSSFAASSGPYTNLNYGPGTNCTDVDGVETTCPTSTCALLEVPTRGIHGMTCTAVSTANQYPSCTGNNCPAQAAIKLDSDNNSIEDIHFEGFFDGVVVGDSGAAAGNVLANLTGGCGPNSGPVKNVVHICNSAAVAMSACTTSGSAENVTILGVGVGGGEGGNCGTSAPFHAHAIRDDVTSTIIDESTSGGLSGEGTVGVYALGEVNATGANGHTRFTTGPIVSQTVDPSPNPSPTWATGQTGSSAPTGSCPTGSVFSNTTGTTLGSTLYVCVGTPPNGVWTPLP